MSPGGFGCYSLGGIFSIRISKPFVNVFPHLLLPVCGVFPSAYSRWDCISLKYRYCFRNRLVWSKDDWNSQYLFCAQFLGCIFQLIAQECYHLFWEHCKRSQWTKIVPFLWPAYEPKTDRRLKNCMVNVTAKMLNICLSRPRKSSLLKSERKTFVPLNIGCHLLHKSNQK